MVQIFYDILAYVGVSSLLGYGVGVFFNSKNVVIYTLVGFFLGIISALYKIYMKHFK